MRKNLVLLGMMGVGKSTLGRFVADKYKLNFVDIDTRIEKKNLMSVTEIFEVRGEKFFRDEEEKITIDSLNEKNSIIALGGGAFINKKIRDKVLTLAISFWLDNDVNILKKRLKINLKRPMLKNGNTEENLKTLYNQRKHIYNLANYKIKCDKLSIKKISEKIISIYEKH